MWIHAKIQAPEQIQGKVSYAYLDSIQKGKKKPNSLQSVSSAEFHLLKLENVVVLYVLKNPQRGLLLSFYVLNKQITKD